jgi:hypothetical protein
MGNDLSNLIETWRRRVDLMRAKTRLVLQGKAICRRFCGGDKAAGTELFDAVCRTIEIAAGNKRKKATEFDIASPMFIQAIGTLEPYINAMLLFEARLKIEEPALERMAHDLPVWKFALTTPGFSALSLAGIVAEAGEPLGHYRTVAGLWKPMGLAVIDGERQRKCKDEEKAKRHGYAPQRRSLMWVVGDCIIKAQIRSDKDEDGERIGSTAIGPLGELYLQHKAYQAGRDPEMRPITAHLRAKRYVEKRLLRQLWQAWREVERGDQKNDADQRSDVAPPDDDMLDAAE